MSLEISHLRWSHLDGVPKTHEYIILRGAGFFFVVQGASHFCGDVVRVNHFSFAFSPGENRVNWPLPAARILHDAARVLARYFLLVPPRRQLNDRNSGAGALSPLLPPSHPPLYPGVPSSLDLRR